MAQGGNFVAYGLDRQSDYVRPIERARAREVAAGRDVGLKAGEELREGVDQFINTAARTGMHIGDELILDANRKTDADMASVGRYQTAQSDLAAKEAEVSLLQRQLKKAEERMKAAPEGSPMRQTATQQLWLLEDKLTVSQGSLRGLQSAVNQMEQTKVITEFTEKINAQNAEKTLGRIAANRRQGAALQAAAAPMPPAEGMYSINVPQPDQAPQAPVKEDMWTRLEQMTSNLPPPEDQSIRRLDLSNPEMITEKMNVNEKIGGGRVDLSISDKLSEQVPAYRKDWKDPWDAMTDEQLPASRSPKPRGPHDEKVMNYLNKSLASKNIPPLGLSEYMFFTSKYGQNLSPDMLLELVAREWTKHGGGK